MKRYFLTRLISFLTRNRDGANTWRRRSSPKAYLLFLGVLISLCWSTLALANISMHITPETARPGETLRLTLTQNDPMHSQETPDLTPLKKEFTLIGTEHSMSYTANNGVATSESQWVILLTPKKTGVLTIPAIKMGQEYSPVGQVNIMNNTTSPTEDNSMTPSDENSAVTLQTEVDEQKPFINQQIIYTVRLATNQSLMEAQYQPPHVENALLIPLGQGRRYQTTSNGKEYSVDEQQYAIYPQKSGVLHIIPPQLSALVYNTIPERIKIEGNDIQLQVKPTPNNHTKHAWLPAKQLTLSEQYDASSTTMNQGSTLIRKITIRAMGLPAELLPTLSFADNPQYNVYPEKPDTHNALRQQELIGTSTLSVTYILNGSGEVVLPSIKLPWYNTQTGQNEIARLPNRKIKVISKEASNQPSSPSIKEPAKNPTLPVEDAHTTPYTLWTAVALACLLTLAVSLGWLFRHHPARPKLNRRSILATLRQTCLKNSPTQAHVALLAWSRQQWPETKVLNLTELSQLISDIELKKQIALLTQALYAKDTPKAWRGEELWLAVKYYRRKRDRKIIKANPLPPINPAQKL